MPVTFKTARYLMGLAISFMLLTFVIVLKPEEPRFSAGQKVGVLMYDNSRYVTEIREGQVVSIHWDHGSLFRVYSYRIDLKYGAVLLVEQHNIMDTEKQEEIPCL